MSDSQRPHSWIGQSVIAAVAVVSALAAAGLLLYVIFKILKNRWDPTVPKLDNAMPYYFANLLVLDIVMAIGSAMNIRWAVAKDVYAGAHCTAQAVIKQIGNNGVAWQTTVIAVYSVVWYNEWNDQHPHLTGPAVVLAIWVGLAIMTAVPPDIDPGFYGPAGSWCWIAGESRARDSARITSTYLWFWLCAVVTGIVYLGIYLDAAGRLAGAFGKNGVWIGLKNPVSGRIWGCGLFGLPLANAGEPGAMGQDPGAECVQQNGPQPNGQEDRERVRRAKNLVWYPVSYTLCIIPQSIIRLIELNLRKDVPLWATILGATILNLSGLINAILYLVGLRHFGIPEPATMNNPMQEGEGMPPVNAPPA